VTSGYEPTSAAPALMAFTRSPAHAAGSFACRPCDAFVTSLRAVARRCFLVVGHAVAVAILRRGTDEELKMDRQEHVEGAAFPTRPGRRIAG
jgi:hypothetical protein